ncbi:hypothetical protein RSE70_004443 [Yersinia enterocolitica]|nr:hypothetical protein [Yersinia enterocolitica]
MKKMIFIAGALLLMATGSYAADSIAPNTEQTVTSDVSFTKVHDINVSVTPISNLVAGRVVRDKEVAKIMVKSTSDDLFATLMDGEHLGPGDTATTVAEKNDPSNKLVVRFTSPHLRGCQEHWCNFPTNEELLITADKNQDVVTGVYPMTLHVALYQA